MVLKLSFFIFCFQILAFDETKEKIFKSMKRLHNQVNTSIVVLNSTTSATGENYISLKKLEKDLSEVKNALKEANEARGARYNKEESFGIDSQVFGEFQTLTNQTLLYPPPFSVFLPLHHQKYMEQFYIPGQN